MKKKTHIYVCLHLFKIIIGTQTMWMEARLSLVLSKLLFRGN